MVRMAMATLMLLLGASTALAQGATLFKVVSTRDEVVIGVVGMDLDALAKKLVADGQVTAWQYAVRKDSKGDLEQAPLRRVAILRQDTLRIEAFATPLKVVPIAP